ncbi:MAG: TonB-dependent receptor [Woeseiaceae bacterium]
MKSHSCSDLATRRVLALLALALFAPMSWGQSDEDSDEKADSEKRLHDEIIVTAEKTEKNIMDTAMTITGFNEAMLKEFGIQDRDKLQLLVPGLQFGETHDQVGNGTSLRGIGTRNAGIDHGDRSVATYVDGAYTIGVYGVAPGGGFDLERVEVARGPQGTLNGRNSIAGSINFIYKKPTQEWDAEVMAQINDYSQQRVNVAVGGPIADNLSFRVTGGYNWGDGYQENVGLGDDMGAPEEAFAAGQLRFQTERFDTNLRVSRVEDKGIPPAQVQLANLNTTDPQIQIVGAYSVGNQPPFVLDLEDNTNYLYATPAPSGPSSCPIGVPFQRCGDIENKVAMNRSSFEDSEADMINFYAQYDFTDNVSLRYTYADNEVHQYVFRDGDYTNRVGTAADHTASTDGGVPFIDRAYDLPYDYDEESHELLLTWNISDKMDLIVGAFTYESNVQFELTRWEYSHDFRFVDPDVAAAALDGAFGVPVSDCRSYIDNVVGGVFGLPTTDGGDGSFWYCPGDFGIPGREVGDLRAIVPFGTGSKNETQAVFANLDYEINDTWAVSGGLRWLEDDKVQPPSTFAGSFMFSFIGVPVVVGFQDGGFDQPESWDNIVGQFTLEYTTDNDNMIYGRISTGHKPGVFNFASPPVPGVPTVVEESTLINYETGVKGFYLDDRLQVAASAFYMDYDKMHLAATQELAGGFIPNPNNPTPLAEYIAAIPDSKVYGLEVEYSYAFNDRWSLVGYYAYTDSEVGPHESVVLGDPNASYELYDYIDFETGMPTQGWYELPQDQTGNQLPSQPNHKAAMTLMHDRDLTGGSSLSFLGTWAYNGSMYPTIANVDLYEIDAYSRFDASATWTSSDQDWSAQLYVNNILDEIGLNEFIASGGFGGQVFLGSPTNHREIGLTIRWTPDL